ncbi:MAG TPA: N-6 DNA methylase, partial [Methanocorpusculum sp.]|nr:N-6 DNA methylase [Methanocorpusculum sp.]
VGEFSSRENAEYFARLVSYDEIKEENYNLSVTTYVEKEDTREVIDIRKLNAKIKEIVKREDELRREIDKIIAEIEG